MPEKLDLTDYQRFWVAAENSVSQVFPHAELDTAIAEYQFQLKQGDSPRFLGEQADASLHDLTASITAFSSSQDR